MTIIPILYDVIDKTVLARLSITNSNSFDNSCNVGAIDTFIYYGYGHSVGDDDCSIIKQHTNEMSTSYFSVSVWFFLDFYFKYDLCLQFNGEYIR